MKPRTLLERSLAPVALMALIFWLSAQPELSTDLGLIDLILRKIAHMAVFGTLAVLWWWALRPLTPRALGMAVAIAALYAISDEYHQTFVEGRNGTPVDVAIDWVGIWVAALLVSRRVPSGAWAEEGAG
jgi:hypothetical protein